jgi:hypothetical protein
MNTPLFLETFFLAYIEAALFSSIDDKDQPLDRNYDIGCFNTETLNQMKKDCLKFFNDNSIDCFSDHEQKLAGHDFWLTRNRHGAGFWDGDWQEPFATLATSAAHSFGEYDLIVGDDYRIYGPIKKEDKNEILLTA